MGKKKVAKVRNEDLRNSPTQVIRLMASKKGYEFKFITQSQLDELLRDGRIRIYPLTDEDKVTISTYLNNIKQKVPSRTKSSVIQSTPVIVTYKDEDGESTVTFDSLSEATEWIRVQEMRVSSGEKFEFLELKPANS